MASESFAENLSNGADRMADATEAATDRVSAAAERAFGLMARAADQASDAYDAVRVRAQTTADATDAFVKGRPYAALGVAALVGVVFGALMLSRSPKVIYIKPARVQGA